MILLRLKVRNVGSRLTSNKKGGARIEKKGLEYPKEKKKIYIYIYMCVCGIATYCLVATAGRELLGDFSRLTALTADED